nr:superinfection immunity protein [Chromobacterium sp. ASV5]
MKHLPLLRKLLLSLLFLILALWLIGSFGHRPQLVTLAEYLGDALVMAGAYLLPTVTAVLVNSPRLKKIALLNALGGWLILPWLLAMGWALKRDDLTTDPS